MSGDTIDIEAKREEARSVPGVKFDKKSNRFVARIMVRGKDTFIGAYDTAEEAGEAYQARKAGVVAAKREAAASDSEDRVHYINADDYAPKSTRVVGHRPRYAGIVQNREGKFVTKLRLSVSGQFKELGIFDDIEEADRVHREAWLEERFRYAWDEVPDTLEDALVELAKRRSLITDRMTMQEFRDEAERAFPTLLDHFVPVSALLKDEMLQARGGWRIAKRPDAAGHKDPSPWMVFE